MKLFAGPCSLESKELCFEVARTIRDNLPTGIDYYFKTSFAKENRSSSTSFMGAGECQFNFRGGDGGGGGNRDPHTAMVQCIGDN